MAILIQQSPTTPNMANNDLVFSVTSSQVTQSQFQFVADLTYSGSSTVLQRIKQQANPNARGVFDFGSIVTNYLSEDNLWKTAKFAQATESAKRFNFRFGEQYGTSVSSSITLYTGNANIVGAPAVSASNYIFIANGLVDPNNKVNWNFASQSYFQTITTPTSSLTTRFEYALTNAPTTKSVQVGEYETLSVFNGNFTNSTTLAQDVYALQVLQYSGSTLISSSITYNTTGNGGGPRSSTASIWSDSGVYNGQTAGTQLLYVGVGPLNLSAAGTPISSSATSYVVRGVMQSESSTANTSSWFFNRTYNIEGPSCGYDGVRFAWKNEFGVWDYYTFTLQTDKSFNIERANYQQSFVPFGDNTPIPYNKQRRGTTNYYNKPTQTQVANSDWLDQNTSDWLKELFFSANVFVQEGTEFLPVAITSVDVIEKTNPRSPLFQYQIAFQVANQINPRI